MIFLGDNGAMVYQEDRLLFTQPMAFEHARECLEFISLFSGIVPVVSSAGTAYVLEQQDPVWREIHRFYAQLTVCQDLTEAARKDPVAKIALYLPDGNAETFARNLESAHLPVCYAVSGKDWIDLMEPGVNKGTALRELMRRLGIVREECMAFGDYMNDIEMLENAGFSFAMGNAIREVKRVCRYETAANDEDGVMKILRLTDPDGNLFMETREEENGR